MVTKVLKVLRDLRVYKVLRETKVILVPKDLKVTKVLREILVLVVKRLKLTHSM